MAPYERTTIQITKDQHEKLERVKEVLEYQASQSVPLSQSSWEPSFSDALTAVIQTATEEPKMLGENKENQLVRRALAPEKYASNDSSDSNEKNQDETEEKDALTSLREIMREDQS